MFYLQFSPFNDNILPVIHIENFRVVLTPLFHSLPTSNPSENITGSTSELCPGFDPSHQPLPHHHFGTSLYYYNGLLTRLPVSAFAPFRLFSIQELVLTCWNVSEQSSQKGLHGPTWCSPWHVSSLFSSSSSLNTPYQPLCSPSFFLTIPGFLPPLDFCTPLKFTSPLDPLSLCSNIFSMRPFLITLFKTANCLNTPLPFSALFPPQYIPF